jgi:dyslexia-associated protein KIAA0319-like protein
LKNKKKNFAIVNGVSTNKNEIAIVENLIEGDYTFILKIWTNASSTHYSQSSMQVLVHSSGINSTIEIYENNLLKLDLNLNPFKFLDIEKVNLLTNIQLVLKKHLRLKEDNDPKIMVLNQEILKKYSKSGISIEFYVLNEINNEVIDSGLVMKILYKLLFKSDENFLKLNEQNTKNSNDLLIFDYFFHNQLVYDLKQMKCLNNCSDHGYCDPFTYMCVCDRYWFFNIYKFYSFNYNDETYGNNCGNLFFCFEQKLTFVYYYFYLRMESYICFFGVFIDFIHYNIIYLFVFKVLLLYKEI